MIAAFLLAGLAPAGINGLPLGALPRQSLPAQGCAAYLFTTGATPTFAAMASATPATLRVALDGKVADFARVPGDPAGDFGLAGTSRYAAADAALTLSMTVKRRDDLAGGALVPEATLTIERTGRDSVVVPMGGMIGCRP